jgi:hypothetical protein
MFERGNYRVVHVEYMCHPETCCHDDHPAWVVQEKKFGQWWWKEDFHDYQLAQKSVMMLADQAKIDVIIADLYR